MGALETGVVLILPSRERQMVSGCRSIRPCRSPGSPVGDRGLRQRGSWEHRPGWMHREHLAGWGLQATRATSLLPSAFPDPSSRGCSLPQPPRLRDHMPSTLLQSFSNWIPLLCFSPTALKALLPDLHSPRGGAKDSSLAAECTLQYGRCMEVG